MAWRPPPSPTTGEYEVDAIVGVRENSIGTEFQVHWTGYPIEERTWEPIWEMQNCTQLAASYLLAEIGLLNEMNGRIQAELDWRMQALIQFLSFMQRSNPIFGIQRRD